MKDGFNKANLLEVITRKFRWTDKFARATTLRKLPTGKDRWTEESLLRTLGADTLTGADLDFANLAAAIGLTPTMLASARNVEFATLPEGITMEDIKAARATLSQPPAAHPEPEL